MRRPPRARDKCSKAATDAKDLIAQQQTMTAQRNIVNEELSACRNSVG